MDLRCNQCSPAIGYTDDTTAVVSAKTEAELQFKLNFALDAFERYLVSNKMAINPGKTEILRVGYRLGEANCDTLELEATDDDGKHIGPKPSVRLLGISLCRNLTWNCHLRDDKAAVHKRIRTRLSALKCLGRYISPARKLILANGLINSIVVYCIQVWGCSASKNLMKQTQVLQN